MSSLDRWGRFSVQLCRKAKRVSYDLVRGKRGQVTVNHPLTREGYLTFLAQRVAESAEERGIRVEGVVVGGIGQSVS